MAAECDAQRVEVCKNDTGGPWAPWQLKRWDIAGGALYNGMVLPYVNM